MTLRDRIFIFSRTHPKHNLWTESSFLTGMGLLFTNPIQAYLDFALAHSKELQELTENKIIFWIHDTKIKNINDYLDLLEMRSPSEHGFYTLEPKVGRRMARLHLKFPCYSFFNKRSIGENVFVRRPKETKTYMEGVIVDIIPENTKDAEKLNKYLPEDQATKELKAAKNFPRLRYVVDAGGEFIVIPDSPIFYSNIRPRRDAT
jgi:hypothetical protein